MSKYFSVFFSTLLTSCICFAQTDANSLIAKKIIERMTGVKVPANDPLLLEVSRQVASGNYRAAAEAAQKHPNFLNVTVKQMALKMSTREESIRLKLNDFSAGFIGVTRDQTDARELLYGNFYYAADPAKVPAGINVRNNLSADILRSNNHYDDLDNPKVDVGQVLKRFEGQMLVDGVNSVVANPDPAGIITSRAFMGAHATAGTARRPVEYTFREFMCVPIEQWTDTKASDQYIGRDIDRYPAGDHMKFQTTCKGCHTQMDSLRGAFAKWDFAGNRIINGNLASKAGDLNGTTGLSNKVMRNATVFPGGWETKDDTWENNSRGPANVELFGWRGTASRGKGANELGKMVSNSKRFSACMVKRVYDAVCRTQLSIKDNLPFIREMANQFESKNYNLKLLFQDVAVTRQCLGI